LTALFVVLLVGGAVLAAGTAGVVAWPVSTLLVSEVQTGGASASDEFAEITNAGASAVDLAGIELVYSTSTGTTVTRKAAWAASVMLEPGRHLLVANTAGIYASLADATYSGGFAATGGAVALRVIGGSVIDAVGWGDATNGFVEGAAMAAPAAGASIERKPGGIGGNTVDSNANAVDWFAQATPGPQSLAAPPVPAPIATASPVPTASSTAVPTPNPTATPTATATAEPTATVPATVPATSTPSASPEPSATAEPSAAADPTATPAATAAPTPTIAPTPSPTPEPTATPEPTSIPEPTLAPTAGPTVLPTATAIASVSIAAARLLPDDASATIVGVLTTPLGALEAGRKAFVQDDTGGIAIYLDAVPADSLPAGTIVVAAGTLDDRFAERTLRVSLTNLAPLGAGVVPEAASAQTGAIGESVEGSRVLVSGVTVGSPSDLSDGVGLMVDDGSGQVRVIVATSLLGGTSVTAGTTVIAAGPVGQRDSGGTGLAGYRIHVTAPDDFQILPGPTPTPTAAPTPTVAASTAPTPTPSPSNTPVPTATSSPTPPPTASPTATPKPSPTATPGPTPPPVLDIVEARGATLGTIVTVAGVVTAEAGRLGTPPLIAIADGTGGIAVRLPDGVTAPARGTTILVKGALADPYGQLELRPTAAGISITGHGSLPVPAKLTAAQLGEANEGRLAEIIGTVTASPRKGTSNDLSVDLVDASGTAFRVVTDGSSGIAPTDLVKDKAYRLTGIVGQRATRKGALDGYRLYVRDRGDIVAIAGGGSPGASPSPGASGGVTVIAISKALAVPDDTRVTIEGTVTAGVELLDSSGRRIVVQDRSGAIEILLPSGSKGLAVGTRVRVTGSTGLAWGAPRIAATEVVELGSGGNVGPRDLHRSPAERDEWQLVRISGTVAKVNRIGERWRAEVTLADGTAALVQGQAGAGIPSTAIVAGRKISVTGIVRRPYPTSSDRRFSILPRGTADIATGAGEQGGSGGGGSGAAGSAGATGPTGSADPSASSAAITPDTDLATLTDLVGRRVKVGGLIARIADDGFDLDDGTALARVELRGEMLALLPHIRAGEAIAASGMVELADGAPVVVLDDAGSLVRVGSLGQALPIGDAPLPSPTGEGGGAPVNADSTAIGSPAPASLFAIATLTALSVLATVLRRRLAQRRLRFALIARLASLRAGSAASPRAGASVGRGRPEHESA
jgi:uncharacterized protein YdeI (BOF family)